MRNAFYILTILLLMVGCIANGTKAVPGPKVDKSRLLCGSRLTVERAALEADLIIHVRALDTPLGEQEEIGVRHYFGSFEVISVLKGEFDGKKLKLHYDCIEVGLNEREIREGEEVIAFIERPSWFSAKKFIVATEEAKKQVEGIISKYSDDWPRSLPAERLWFRLVDPDNNVPGARSLLHGTTGQERDYWEEDREPARSNWPISVVGRLARRFKILDSFETKLFILKGNRLTAEVAVTRRETDRVQPDKVAYFEFKLPDVKLKAGNYRLTLRFDTYLKPKMGRPGEKKLIESFSEECRFSVLKGRFCGSKMPLEKAAEQANMVIHASAMNTPCIREEMKAGVTRCACWNAWFKIISVLKGMLAKKKIAVVYESLPGMTERHAEKGDEVILFIKEEKNLQAIKIISATEQAIERVKKLLRKHGAVSGEGPEQGEK